MAHQFGGTIPARGFAATLDPDSRKELELHDAHIAAFEKSHRVADIDAAIDILRHLTETATPIEGRAFLKAMLADRIQYYRYNATHELGDIEEVLRLFLELES